MTKQMYDKITELRQNVYCDKYEPFLMEDLLNNEVIGKEHLEYYKNRNSKENIEKRYNTLINELMKEFNVNEEGASNLLREARAYKETNR